jgi:hypothetical protein
MSSLPNWMHLAVIAIAVLLSPVLAFLFAIAAEIVVGAIAEVGGTPAIIAIVVLIVGCLLARKLVCPPGGASVET